MNFVINSKKLTGTVLVPPSKSLTQRAFAAALLHNGTSRIFNAGDSNDDKAALSITQQLGAQVNKKSECIEIVSQGLTTIQSCQFNVIYAGESGLSLRMFTAIAALSGRRFCVVGQGSLLHRPIPFFEQVFPRFGIKVYAYEQKLPLIIIGDFSAKNINVDGSQSSQYITGLVMAYAAIAKKSVTIKIDNLKSKPYLDLTLDVLRDFELNVPEHKNYETLHFKPNQEKESSTIEYKVEGDWSNAAFWLVAAVLHPGIMVAGLNPHSKQGDSAILKVIESTGAKIITKKDTFKIKAGKYKAFEFDATDCPDLFPPLVVLAAFAKGVSKIKGVHRLAGKESNRSETLQSEFEKLGLQIVFEDDEMIIEGGQDLSGALASSCNDHRIAMALAIIATKIKGETAIENAEAIDKSYPQFFEDLKMLFG